MSLEHLSHEKLSLEYLSHEKLSLEHLSHVKLSVKHLSHEIYVTGILTYLLTPWSRVLLEKPTVNFAASQEIPHINGTRKSLTIPTSARHLSLP
jgi:hypothetical protein